MIKFNRIVLLVFSLSFFFACMEEENAEVRIRNASETGIPTLANIKVGGVSFGDIPSGETTGYKKIDKKDQPVTENLEDGSSSEFGVVNISDGKQTVVITGRADATVTISISKD